MPQYGINSEVRKESGDFHFVNRPHGTDCDSYDMMADTHDYGPVIAAILAACLFVDRILPLGQQQA